MQPNPSYAPHIGSGSSQAYGSPAGHLAGPASFMGAMMGLGPKGPSQDPLQGLIMQRLLGGEAGGMSLRPGMLRAMLSNMGGGGAGPEWEAGARGEAARSALAGGAPYEGGGLAAAGYPGY